MGKGAAESTMEAEQAQAYGRALGLSEERIRWAILEERKLPTFAWSRIKKRMLTECREVL